MRPKISTVVCTHNRAHYLRKALASLELQTLPKDAFDIIVVDNRSSDDTKKVVFEEFGHLTNLRYLFEPVLGLSQARNTGWQSSAAPYVAFLDDDAIADPDWLASALRVFNSNAARIALVGGPVRPIWERPRPSWLAESLLSYFTILDGHRQSGVVHDSQLIVGANMILRHQAILQAGGFLTTLGRRGSCLLSKEETALRERLTELDYLSFFDEEVSVQHHIPADRVNKQWLLQRIYWNGISTGIWWRIKESPTRREILNKMLSSIKELGVATVAFVWSLLTSRNKEALFLKRTRIAKQWGMIRAFVAPPVTVD